MTPLLLMVTGALAGLLGALVGVGGGVVLVPVLVLGFGVPMGEAVPVSLLCVVASSCGAAAAFVERRLSDVRLALVLELATVAGAIAGGVVAGLLAPDLIALTFGLFALYVALQLLFGVQGPEPERAPAGAPHANLALGMSGSFLAGGLSAVLGVGGGPLKVPLMRYGMHVPFRVATATSNLMIGVTGAASVATYALRGQVRLELAAPMVVGVLAGAVLGSRVMVRAPVAVLKRVLALVLLTVAVQMLWKGGGGSWVNL